MTRYTLLFFSLFISLYMTCFATSRQAPMLDGIKVWEYYKYENGAFHNYAVVINTQDKALDVTIIRAGNFYERPFRYVRTEHPYDSADQHKTLSSSTREFLPMTPEDSARLGKCIIRPGDTLLSGIRLKKHEIRIIPDLFEKLRGTPEFHSSPSVKPRSISEVRVLVNGKYAGGYEMRNVSIPETIPKSGIVICTTLNSGNALPAYIQIDETRFVKNETYTVNIFPTSNFTIDSFEIKVVPADQKLDAFWGMKYLMPNALDTATNPNFNILEYQTNAKGQNKLLHAKIPAETKSFALKMKAPDNKSVLFTGFELRHFRKYASGGYAILLPMNIKL